MRISWVGLNKTCTICHFFYISSIPRRRPLCGLFWDLWFPQKRPRFPPFISRYPFLNGGKPSFWGEALLEEFLFPEVAWKNSCPLLKRPPCYWESLPPQPAGRGQVSGTQHSVPGRCGRSSSLPKRGTATIVLEFLGQQVWKPIWSAGIFTRLENKPE